MLWKLRKSKVCVLTGMVLVESCEKTSATVCGGTQNAEDFRLSPEGMSTRQIGRVAVSNSDTKGPYASTSLAQKWKKISTKHTWVGEWVGSRHEILELKAEAQNRLEIPKSDRNRRDADKAHSKFSTTEVMTIISLHRLLTGVTNSQFVSRSPCRKLISTDELRILASRLLVWTDFVLLQDLAAGVHGLSASSARKPFALEQHARKTLQFGKLLHVLHYANVRHSRGASIAQ